MLDMQGIQGMQSMHGMQDMQEKVAEGKSGYYNNLADRAKYDRDAFCELYDYFFPRVYNFIFARVKNAGQADDIISVTFEKAFLKLSDYDSGRGAFSTWLFRIAVNEMNNLFRTQKKLNETGWEDFFDPADGRNTPEQQILSDEGSSFLLVALDKLKDRERRVVSLKYFTGISNKEIAELENMTANNVGVVLHRALDKLKVILEGSGYSL